MYSQIITINENNYLKHYGIDNQQWGVRHGPPYPLPKGVSRSIKRAGDKGLESGIKSVTKSVTKYSNQKIKDKALGTNKAKEISGKEIALDAVLAIGTTVVSSLVLDAVMQNKSKVYRAGKRAAKNALFSIKDKKMKFSAARKGYILV